MTSPTLKVRKYRGLTYYIRHLYRECFEILVPAYGSLHVHQHEWNRIKRLKNTPYKKDELATIGEAMDQMAQVLIDDIVFQHTIEMQPSRIAKRLLQRSIGYLKFIHYKAGILKDNVEARFIIKNRKRLQAKPGGKPAGRSEV